MIFALSVGPIFDSMYEVFEKENKTKRLKAASYFFSLFMKEYVKRLRKEIEVIVPYADDEVFEKDLSNFGYFHDRLIAKSEKNIEELKTIAQKIENEIFEKFSKKYGLNKEELKKDIFRYYLIEEEEELKKVDKNLVSAINKILDSLELSPKFTQTPTTIIKDGVEKIVNSISKYQDYYITHSKKVKSIENIQEGDYFAVVVADGNKMGSLINKKGFENIKEISKGLFDFITNIENKDIYQITEELNGELIYAGGDDVLAFLPISKVFEYIETLNKNFKKYLGDETSLSFGISVNYYKFPLRKAIKEAWSLLYEAKDKGDREAAFLLLLRKHSGQVEKIFHKLNDKSYEHFKDIKDSVLGGAPFIKGFHHNLRRYEKAILSFYKHNRTHIVDAFENMFNEASEKEFETIKKVADYLDYIKPKEENEFDKIFYDLSFIKFLGEKVKQ